MNCRLGNTDGNRSVSGILFSIRKLLLMLGPVLLATTGPTIAQNGELQQKLAAVKQAAAANQQQLRQYQWTETTQVTLKGDAKPSSQKLCQYGPDGQVQKTPIGAPPEQPSGGRMSKGPPHYVFATRSAENAASFSSR